MLVFVAAVPAACETVTEYRRGSYCVGTIPLSELFLELQRNIVLTQCLAGLIWRYHWCGNKSSVLGCRALLGLG